MASDWTPSSWTTKPINQDVAYEDRAGLESAVGQLRQMPPLITPREIETLKGHLREVALGRAFVLHGGDCAELFNYCAQDKIESKVKLLLQMSLVLIWGGGKPVVRIARIAGQYAKPRSSPTETVDGITLPAFRGEIVNAYPFSPASRTPDPSRLVSAYFHSAATLNYLRAALASGLADLHSPLDWGLGHVVDASIAERYAGIVGRVTDAIRFMQTVGLDRDRGVETADVFTSHEALVLEYEQALVRPFPAPAPAGAAPTAPNPPPFSASTPVSASNTTSRPTRYYDTSAHFIWVGDRTRTPGTAHLELVRGLSNPIGIKVGPSTTPASLTAILAAVDPDREPGRVTLITRYGAANVASCLPGHIDAVRRAGHMVVWQCDPMHGNTRAEPQAGSTGSIKTRHFTDIITELTTVLETHAAHGSFLGGLHLELTGEPVTECVGGAGGLTVAGLSERYESFCDPRLNEKQALEIAFLVAEFYRK